MIRPSGVPEATSSSTHRHLFSVLPSFRRRVLINLASTPPDTMDASAAKQDQPNNSYGGAEVLSSVDKNNDAATQKPADRAESTQECAKENEEKIQSDSSAADISVERIPVESVFDGTEKANELAGEQDDKSPVNEMPQDHNKGRFSALEFARKGVDWPEKAAAIKSFVIDRGAVMTNAFRRLSLKVEDLVYLPDKDSENAAADHQQEALSGFQSEKFVDAARSLQNGFERPEIKGRIILFSKSGCEESRAIRSLFRRKGQHFYEVNVDIFPKKKMDLEERTGTSDVPKVFFNENLVGGIDELCALEARKELDEKIKDVLETECPPTAPQPVTFGEDEQDPVAIDEFSEVVCKLREKVQVKDRFYKMRLFSRCFPGSEALEVFAEVQHCEKEKAVEFGRQVAARHFFHHVLQENLFEDGNHVYRFLEHDPIISMKCFNVNGNINDAKPLLATEIEENLRKFTLAIIDSYVSDDGKSVDYRSISMSEEFRRYVKMTESLHRFDLSTFTREEKLAFFINLYNMMIIHGIIMFGHPNGPLDRRRLFRDFQYLVGGYAYSLSAIQNGVLRSNQRPPYQLIKPFGPKDKRLPVALPEPECLIHFALTIASRSSPALKCYSPRDIDAELRAAVRAFFLDGGVSIDMETKTVSLSKIINWFSTDFGKNDQEILRWLVNHLEPSKAENLLELLDGNHFKIVYQPYDWSPNL